MVPIRAKIVSSEPENSKVSLLTFDISLKDAKPGQFVMLSIAGGEEKPMSIANAKPLQIAIARAGKTSTKMANMKKGEFLYVRGPYGKPFWQIGKKLILVGGGYGFAPLRFFAKEAKKRGAQTESIMGARTKDLLMKQAVGKNHVTTDDGSAGIKGNVLDALEPLLKKSKYDCIYSCGPEKMMEAVAKMAKKYKVKSQLSVERYMKCGFGICGHCSMGGWLSCIDGPTIDGEEALANYEFGKICKDKVGRKVRI